MNILITGASSGIGRALAKYFNATGNTLFISARREERLSELANELEKSGNMCFFQKCDVANKADTASMVAKAIEEMGSIDLAILSAGVGRTANFTELDCEPFRYTFDINLFGVLHSMEYIIPAMLKQGHGKIAAVSSMADVRGIPYSSAYSSSKAALTRVLEAARIELKPLNIDVVTIRPGFVKSEMTDQNKFKMPLLMPVERAARIIAHGLAKHKAYINFPYRTNFVAAFMRVIPNPWYEFIMGRVRAN
ncbi:MAG: SDR family NAD(P)-dependent oxidoreductase [bacterium]